MSAHAQDATVQAEGCPAAAVLVVAVPLPSRQLPQRVLAALSRFPRDTRVVQVKWHCVYFFLRVVVFLYGSFFYALARRD